MSETIEQVTQHKCRPDFDACTWDIVDLTQKRLIVWRQAVSGRPHAMIADFGEWELVLDTERRTMEIWRGMTYLNWPPSAIVSVLVDTVKKEEFDIEVFLIELRSATGQYGGIPSSVEEAYRLAKGALQEKEV